MPFNSLTYFLFLPLLWIIFQWTPDRLRWLLLLAASLGFYAMLIPTVDLVNEMDKVRHEQVLDIFRDYAAQDKGVTFLDYNPAFSHRYELFCDPIHLNRDGQQMVTDKALVDLKNILTLKKHLTADVRR